MNAQSLCKRYPVWVSKLQESYGITWRDRVLPHGRLYWQSRSNMIITLKITFFGHSSVYANTYIPINKKQAQSQQVKKWIRFEFRIFLFYSWHQYFKRTTTDGDSTAISTSHLQTRWEETGTLLWRCLYLKHGLVETARTSFFHQKNTVQDKSDFSVSIP